MDNRVEKAVIKLCNTLNKQREERYNEIMREAQRDKRFERMIQDMTIGQGSALNKYATRF